MVILIKYGQISYPTFSLAIFITLFLTSIMSLRNKIPSLRLTSYNCFLKLFSYLLMKGTTFVSQIKEEGFITIKLFNI